MKTKSTRETFGRNTDCHPIEFSFNSGRTCNSDNCTRSCWNHTMAAARPRRRSLCGASSLLIACVSMYGRHKTTASKGVVEYFCNRGRQLVVQEALKLSRFSKFSIIYTNNDVLHSFFAGAEILLSSRRLRYACVLCPRLRRIQYTPLQCQLCF